MFGFGAKAKLTRLLATATEAARAGRKQEALEASDEAWRIANEEERSVEARQEAAMTRVNVCVHLGEWQGAELALQRLCTSLAASPGPETLVSFEAQRTLVDLLSQRGKWAQAASVLEKLCALVPRGTPDRLVLEGELAGLQSQAGQHERAVTLIDAVLERVDQLVPFGHERWVWARQCAATISMRAGDLDTTERLLTQVMEPGPGEHGFSVALTLVELSRRRGRFEQALSVLDQLERAETGPIARATLTETRADVLRDAGRLDEALLRYQASATLVKQTFGDGHFNLLTLYEGWAQALRAAGRATEAARLDEERQRIQRVVRGA